MAVEKMKKQLIDAVNFWLTEESKAGLSHAKFAMHYLLEGQTPERKREILTELMEYANREGGQLCADEVQRIFDQDESSEESD